MNWQPSMLPMSAGRPATRATSRSSGVSTRLIPCWATSASMNASRRSVCAWSSPGSGSRYWRMRPPPTGRRMTGPSAEWQRHTAERWPRRM